MGCKTKMDVMKEAFCKQFNNYLEKMDENKLYEFVQILQSNQIVEQLSEKCGKIKYPEEVLSCEKCEKIYGECMMDPINGISDCKKRFKQYCRTSAESDT